MVNRAVSFSASHCLVRLVAVVCYACCATLVLFSFISLSFFCYSYGFFCLFLFPSRSVLAHVTFLCVCV